MQSVPESSSVVRKYLLMYTKLSSYVLKFMLIQRIICFLVTANRKVLFFMANYYVIAQIESSKNINKAGIRKLIFTA